MKLVDRLAINNVPPDARNDFVIQGDQTSIERIRISSWIGFVLYVLLFYIDILRTSSGNPLYERLPFRILEVIHILGVLFLPIALSATVWNKQIRKSPVRRAMIIYGFVVIMMVAIFSNAVLSLHVSQSMALYSGFILMSNWAVSMNFGQRLGFNVVCALLIIYFILFPVSALDLQIVIQDARVDRTIKIFEAVFLTIIAFIFSIVDRGYRLQNFLITRELAHEKEQLARSERTKSRLFTNITHEFRNPLTIISGITEQLRGRARDEDSSRLRMIHNNSGRMLTLVNQLLALSKLDTGDVKHEPRKGDIVPFLKYVEDCFSIYAESKGISLVFSIPYKKLNVQFDQEVLFKVLSNLLSNAIKYAGDGGTVRLSLDVVERNGISHLQISVIDSGPGIAASDLPHIFERFYQADTQWSREGSGTGIGLSMVRELTEVMAGTIEVESQLGQGSKFILTIPAEYIGVHVSEQRVTLEDTSRIEATPFGRPHLRETSMQMLDRPTVLVVEDNPDVNDFITSCLEDDFDVIRAFDGTEGENLAMDLVPDVIISDVLMPGQDGFEMTRRLSDHEVTSHIPIFLVTALAEAKDRSKGLEAGAIDCIQKPFDPADLKAKVVNVIELRRSIQDHLANLPDENIAAPQGPEEIFVAKLREVVVNRIDDVDLRVNDLCRGIGLSRTQLHNKLKVLTGKSATAFIRDIRLREACRLLAAGTLNVSEVAYDVGFADPSYFSRVFHSVFGMTPSEYASLTPEERRLIGKTE